MRPCALRTEKRRPKSIWLEFRHCPVRVWCEFAVNGNVAVVRVDKIDFRPILTNNSLIPHRYWCLPYWRHVLESVLAQSPDLHP